MANLSSFILTLALVLPFTSWAQGEVQFNRSQSTVQIDRVFVLAGESKPCKGVEIDAQSVAEYAEVRLLSQYEILERKHLEMILKEQSLGMSGLVFEDQAVEAGCLQGSEGVVFCEVGCLAGQSMIKLKLVDCKESVQQWSALSLDVRLPKFLDEVTANLSGIVRARSEDDDLGLRTNGCEEYLEFDGYTYSIIEIEDKCWFQNNLRSNTYATGSSIPMRRTAGDTGVGNWMVYDENEGNYSSYGRLYNWHAVSDERGLCPSGWLVPTDADWERLHGHLTASEELMRSSFTPEWGGYCDFSKKFSGAGSINYWWSSSSHGGYAWYRSLSRSSNSMKGNYENKAVGLSVRCIRDAY